MKHLKTNGNIWKIESLAVISYLKHYGKSARFDDFFLKLRAAEFSMFVFIWERVRSADDECRKERKTKNIFNLELSREWSVRDYINKTKNRNTDRRFRFFFISPPK